MNRKLAISHRRAVFAALMALCMCMSWAAVTASGDSIVYALADMAWMFAAFLFVFIQTMRLSVSENARIIILTGFFLRIVVALWGAYGTGGIAVFLKGVDASTFLRIAKEYFKGDYSAFRTYYPYIINIIFKFTGPNGIMVQTVNILCWFLGIKLIVLTAQELYGKKMQLILLCYTFLPYPMIVSTQLLRESMISLLSMLSFYCLWKWMNSGRIKYVAVALLISLLPTILHSGNIALALGICLVYIQWDVRAGLWRRFNWRSFALFLGVLAAVPLYEYIFAKYLPYLPKQLSLEMITGAMPLASGRSIYVSGFVVNNWGEFLLWSIYLVIYYWLSPTPRFWSSPMDIAGFCLDSIPFFFLWIYIFKNVKKDWRRSQAKAGIYILFLYTFIYAWGTGNAGTAMRHRGQLLGIMVMTIVMGKLSQKSISRENS